MVQSPAIVLMSSGRKEFSATKITAYFSPKPSPIASPQVSVPVLETKVRKVEREFVKDMPVETRRRAANATATARKEIGNGPKVNGAPLPSPPPPPPPETPLQQSAPETPAAPTTTSAKAAAASTKLVQNVDKVIFGDLLFDCSYTSRHVREIIGDKVAEGKEMLDRLCVCPHCFKYTAEIVKYLGHLAICERREGGAMGMVPGKRVYRHGNSGWEVWEVDGEDEGLYCQNLSLFAKLFLGDKSVSFDVSSFIFYLLVHTTPSNTSSPSKPSSTPTSQVLGFFSKEKQSWDLNNLACILIFPPWQRKGLGSILMGLSYSISRHEGLIGGPEKPLSELGQRGYVRFWSGEVARWLLEEGRKGREAVTLEEISKGTWIARDDCVEALRSMRVLDESSSTAGEVNIDLESIRQWVEKTKTRLLPTVDKDGWLDEFYCRERPEEEVDEEMEE